jgi:hypothetical protein
VQMMTTEEVHEAGVRRHGAQWYRTNVRVVEELGNTDLLAHDPAIRAAMPRLILRILDGIQFDDGNRWDKESGQWQPQ